MKKILYIAIILLSTSVMAEAITKSYEKGGVAYEVQLNVNTEPAIRCLDRCAKSCLGDNNTEDKTRLIEMENKVLEARNMSKDCDMLKGHTKTNCENKLNKKIRDILDLK